MQFMLQNKALAPAQKYTETQILVLRNWSDLFQHWSPHAQTRLQEQLQLLSYQKNSGGHSLLSLNILS